MAFKIFYYAVLFSTTTVFSGLAYGKLIYFNTSNHPGTIQYSDLSNPSDSTIVSTHNNNPGGGLVISPDEQSMYYSLGGIGGLYKWSESGVELIASGDFRDIEIDSAGNYLYYASSSNLGRISLTTYESQIILSTEGASYRGLALNEASDEIYMTHANGTGPLEGGAIMKVGIDGSGLQTLLEIYTNNLGFPSSTLADIELDVSAGKMYWTDQTANNFSGAISRANLDGSEAEILIDSWGRSIELDLEENYIYWGSPAFFGPGDPRNALGIFRSDLDTLTIESLGLGEFDDVHGIAFASGILPSPSALPPESIPEPPIFTLIGLGLFGLGLARNRMQV